MRINLVRPGLIAALIGVGLLAVELNSRTYSQSHSKEIELVSFHWGITNQQMLTVCIGNIEGGTQSSSRPIESLSLNFVKIHAQSGNIVLEREMRVPAGEFRCVDISHEELVRGGVVPEPTSRIQFLIGITSRPSSDKTETVGSARQITVGAVQSVDVGTGKTVLHQSFKTGQTRQFTIIQDL